MMPLRSGGAGLTATASALSLTDPNDFLDLGTLAIPTTHLWGQQRQAIGGVVLCAVSDNEHFETPTQPATRGPVGMSPMVTEGVAINPTMLFEPAHARPSVVAQAFQQGSRGIPGLEEHGLRTTAEALAGITEPLQCQGLLGEPSFALQPHRQREAEGSMRPDQQHQREALHGLVLLAGKDPGEPSMAVANGLGITVSSLMR
jgi:hypothetical protein